MAVEDLRKAYQILRKILAGPGPWLGDPTEDVLTPSSCLQSLVGCAHSSTSADGGCVYESEELSQAVGVINERLVAASFGDCFVSVPQRPLRLLLAHTGRGLNRSAGPAVARQVGGSADRAKTSADGGAGGHRGDSASSVAATCQSGAGAEHSAADVAAGGSVPDSPVGASSLTSASDSTRGATAAAEATAAAPADSEAERARKRRRAEARAEARAMAAKSRAASDAGGSVEGAAGEDGRGIAAFLAGFGGVSGTAVAKADQGDK
eukprot:TRINITY_DN22658_c0_g1_i2.p1 TRINITY_DN22658_c0_g1~~TRINITY_DN22658_c0_g1_i2.p1  ORF type:complete len:265 (+),score=55.64 TRINITY_DN22658_c0_g1_i2:52-846(+)